MSDSGLYHLREAGLLCDVVLKCTSDGTEVSAHKAVLAGHSSYFKALLCGGWNCTGETTPIDIALDHVRGETLLCWVRAMYRSGSDRSVELQAGLQQAQDVEKLDVEKVKGLYQLCSFYDVPDILVWFEKLVFCEYARHVEISISLLAMMGDRDDHIISFDKLVCLAACNLAQLLRSESRSLLQQLPCGTLQMILRHEAKSTIHGRGMQNVEAIRIWLEGEPLARHHELADLLNSLPMSYSSLYDQLKGACEICRVQGDEISLSAFSAATHDVQKIVDGERRQCKPRHTSMKGLLVFGGRLDVWIGVKECELYDTRRNVWFPAPNLPSDASKVKGCSVPGGAISPGVTTDIFSSESSRWRHCRDASVGIDLKDASSASIANEVYVIGGKVAGNYTSYMSMYHEGGLAECAGCQEERQNQGFAALGGKLYCVGGQSKKVLTSVECYQPELDHWHTLHYAQLSSAVKYPSLVAHEGRLFRIGGRNSERRVLATVEAMDLREGFWSPLPPMLEARSSSGAASVGEALYVCGGTSSNNEDLLSSMECFSSTAGKWFSRAPMSTQRTAHSLAAVCVCACVQ